MNRHLLAVVDDLLSHSKIKGALEPHAYSVEIVSDPTAALSRARSVQPALVIIDLGLQRGDPFELIKIIKEELALPVLAFTNHTDRQGMEKATSLGCDKVAARSEFFGKTLEIVGSLFKESLELDKKVGL